MDKISIIVPVYKVEAFLEKCVNSLIAQTYQNIEIVLVDDGSPDKCPEMCDSYARRYENIHVIHQENGGLSAARNTGIEWAQKHSDSSWIAFVDSDDWVHPQYLELLLKSAVDFGSKISYCQCYYANDRFIKDEMITEVDMQQKSVISVYGDEKYDPNAAWARLYAKDMWKELRYPVGKLHEDRFTTYKLLFQQDKIAVVEHPLYYYYMNPEGICRSKWNYRKLDNIEAAEEQIAYFEKNQLWEAWEITQRQYTKLLIIAMRELKKYEADDKKTYATIQGKLRRQIKQNGRKLDYSAATNFEAYKYAWPVYMKIWRRLFAK